MLEGVRAVSNSITREERPEFILPGWTRSGVDSWEMGLPFGAMLQYNMGQNLRYNTSRLYILLQDKINSECHSKIKMNDILRVNEGSGL